MGVIETRVGTWATYEIMNGSMIGALGPHMKAVKEGLGWDLGCIVGHAPRHD